MKKNFFKMDKKELETWLHLNRKAHAVPSKKLYNRKKKNHKDDKE